MPTRRATLEHLQFFSYIIAGFFGFTAVALIVLLIKYKRGSKTNMLMSARNFILTSILICVLYFIGMYREVVLGQYDWNVIARNLDILAFVLQVYFWVRLMADISFPKVRITPLMNKLTHGGIVLCAGLSAVNYSFLINEYFQPSMPELLIPAVILQCINCVLLPTITIVYFVKCVIASSSIVDRLYMTVTSAALTFYGLWNGIIVVLMFTDTYSHLTVSNHLFDPTSVTLVIINVITLIYVFGRDFRPYYLDSEHSDPEKSIDVITAEMSEEYGLTAREKEIVLLAYGGYTNPHMAKELYISKYTIKNHMHSIFEKMDITSRTELIHMINSKK